MSTLSIIPAAAVADAALSDVDVRVLCAIGTFTNRLGGNMWASVATLAKACNLSDRSVQRALPVLVERGYLRRQDRPGKTALYEVVIQRNVDPADLEQGVTPQSPGGDQPVTTGVTTQSPKRYKERYKERYSLTPEDEAALKGLLDEIWQIYPKRAEPHPFVPFRAAILEVIEHGAKPDELVRAATRYADQCRREQTDPRFVRSLFKFYAEGYWMGYRAKLVNGRTREEWARSGQDVSEFDRLAGDV